MSKPQRLKKGDRVRFNKPNDSEFYLNGKHFYVAGFDCKHCQSIVMLSEKKDGPILFFARRNNWLGQNELHKLPKKKGGRHAQK